MGRRFLYFDYYEKNMVDSVLVYNGSKLEVVSRKDEGGFGVVFNRILELGAKDSIEVYYKCVNLENVAGMFFIRTLSYWYPHNVIYDRASYELIYDYPKGYQIVSCGTSIGSIVNKDRAITSFIEEYPIAHISFDIGHFDSLAPSPDSGLPITVYQDQNSKGMMNLIRTDVNNSIRFYESLFGSIPFKDIKVNQLPYYFGQGSAGLIHYSFITFLQEGLDGEDIRFRAHEVAHQWWGNLADNEAYRDTWITEGLAEYCGFLFYQLAFKNYKACEHTIDQWRKDIVYGSSRTGVGSKAGPIILGYRLNSSKSTDYSTLVYEKGAYIFHMIRYLLHDFKTNSDDDFAAFLKELLVQHVSRPLTTKSLQTV